VDEVMLSWALKCLLLTVLAGGAIVGLQESGLLSRVLDSSGQNSLSVSAEDGNGSGGGFLEEIVMIGHNGHFVTDVSVNGTQVTFLIDTGASHTMLRQEDAARLRLGGGQLRYTVPFQSANGTTYAAPVNLRDVRLGQFQLYDLDAFVNQGDLGISLLGMSFLRQFESYEFLKDRLVLRW
jgi:aspartyl protease family protein